MDLSSLLDFLGAQGCTGALELHEVLDNWVFWFQVYWQHPNNPETHAALRCAAMWGQ